LTKIKPRIDRRKLGKLHHSLEWPRARKYISLEMMPILNKIGDSNFDARLKKPLVKYLVIANVSVIEDFASNLARRIIDENDLDVDELIPNEATPFIQNKTLTKGQAVAISYSFANLAQMDFVYSKMLGFSFLDYIIRVSKEDPYREIKTPCQ
jgi:hypothetical protein